MIRLLLVLAMLAVAGPALAVRLLSAGNNGAFVPPSTGLALDFSVVGNSAAAGL